MIQHGTRLLVTACARGKEAGGQEPGLPPRGAAPAADHRALALVAGQPLQFLVGIAVAG
jgi:hypothetical protein